MRIDITHYGQDYAKVEIQEFGRQKVVEYEVPYHVAVGITSTLRALKRLTTSSASQAIIIDK